jgi:hypothetical protein
MLSRISLSDDSSYIILEVTGEITGESIMPHNIKAHELGREKGIKKYLVDCTNARNMETVLNNYQFAYHDMRHTEGIDVTAIVAAVVAPEDHSHDFLETAAKNSGLNLTLFRDRQKAIEFLKLQ